MYLTIGPSAPDSDFSFIIAKNPAAPPFDRQVGGASTGRRVVGSYTPNGHYSVVVHVDGLSFFNDMRARNEAAYVRAEPWLVCPSNLNGVAVTLRSALHGDPGKDITAERFFAPKSLHAEVGPFPGKPRAEFFAALGLNVNTQEEGTQEVFTLNISTAAPMSVTEFLQKLYVALTIFTGKWAFSSKLDPAQCDKYRELTKGWIESVSQPHRDLIHRRLGLESETTADNSNPDAETTAPPRISLHARRHALILAQIPADSTLVVELGCGEGKLLASIAKALPQATVMGVEASQTQVWRAEHQLKSLDKGPETRTTVQHDNLLYPSDYRALVGADVLILSEVIEHMVTRDRAGIIDLLLNVLQPLSLLITVPNIEANTALFGMMAGHLRHADHKIEYSAKQFQDEIVRPLSSKYEVTALELMPGEEIQPSFCIKAVIRNPATPPQAGKPVVAQRMNEAAYFPLTNTCVPVSSLRHGYTSRPFLDNGKNLFYLGPTIAPVDHMPGAGCGEYLEHPLAAFRYYASKGLKQVVEEPKYMGSRAYLLVFKDPKDARALGFDSPLVANSRAGLPFFRDPVKEALVWSGIAPLMRDGFVILDAEVLPWRLKAEQFIPKDFAIPGEAALLWRRRFQPDAVNDVEEYLRVVRLCSTDSPLEVRAFHMLARGQVKHGKKVSMTTTSLGLCQSHEAQLRDIAEISGEILKPAEHEIVVLGDSESEQRSIDRWLTYCASGGEGFVYKPSDPSALDATGYPIQPALKVRGRDYLRIIYGMDYLQPEYLDRLKSRGTKAKRRLAVQEHEIAAQILRCFLSGNEIERMRAVGAFLGLGSTHEGSIDRTL